MASLWLSGCAVNAPSQVSAVSETPSLPVTGLALYSTYPSDNMTLQCRENPTPCVEDMIAPEAFLKAIKNAPNAASMLASDTHRSDYELLIANLGQQHPKTFWQSVSATLSGNGNTAVQSTQFAEFTVVWRGVELSSTVVKQQFTGSDSDEDMAASLINQWWDSVSSSDVFSSHFLYQSLKASNYRDDMLVPQKIDAFDRITTEWYPDPMEGVISRYVHPDYQEAMLDINVFPIRQSLASDTTSILAQEIHRDYSQARQVAQARNLTLREVQPVSQFPLTGQREGGLRLSLMAESETTDKIYASIYVFRQEDKIVKITTTLPSRFSDSLVAEAMTSIKVPSESVLMATLREQADSASAIQ
ncbi:hypothetical protein [Alteromonas sp. CYL-A6]|uniref:hypothetical protein n=1 Tax=Alteromonas nitratireducens TaxID=3390813 RepID=UPI0034AEA237